MNSVRNFGKNHPVLMAVLGFAIAVWSIYGFAKLFPIDQLGVWKSTVNEIIVTLPILVFALVFCGGHVLKLSMKGFGWSVRRCLYFIVVQCLLAVLALGNLAIKGVAAQESIVVIVIAVTVQCIFIGLFEELAFRTVMFGGLVEKWKGSRSGIIWAAVVSSVIFGAVHNISAVTHGGALGPIEIIQMIEKTTETAMAGMILAAVYLRSRNLWAVAFVHGLTDWVLLLPSTLAGETVSYVVAGSSLQAIMYLVVIIVYVPMLIRSIHTLKQVDLNPVTPFDNEFVPVKPAVDPKLTKEEKRAIKQAAKQNR